MTSPLDRLKATLENRTPGPWSYSCGTIGQANDPWEEVICLETSGAPYHTHQYLKLSSPDAQAICAAMNCIDELVQVAAAARDVIAFTKPPWDTDVDRGDADMALEDALTRLDERMREVCP